MSSLFTKRIQSVLGTKSSSKDEVEWKRNYLNKNICYIRKISLVKKLLKPTVFYLLWKPTKIFTFMPFPFSSGRDRSSPSDMFLEKGVVKICSKFTGEHPCWSTISIKLLCSSVLRHGCSPVNLLHIFRTPFLKDSSGGLLLVVSSLYGQVDLEQILTVKHWLTLKQSVTTSKFSVITFQKVYELNKWINKLGLIMLVCIAFQEQHLISCFIIWMSTW